METENAKFGGFFKTLFSMLFCCKSCFDFRFSKNVSNLKMQAAVQILNLYGHRTKVRIFVKKNVPVPEV